MADKKPTWKKITPGKLYPFPKNRNRRVKPQEVIEATQEELAYVSNQFELVTDGTGKFKVKAKAADPADPDPGEKAPEKDVFTAESVGSGWFNVVSGAGKVMNEKKLRAEAAAELIATLEEEQVQE